MRATPLAGSAVEAATCPERWARTVERITAEPSKDPQITEGNEHGG